MVRHTLVNPSILSDLAYGHAMELAKAPPWQLFIVSHRLQIHSLQDAILPYIRPDSRSIAHSLPGAGSL
jgi:hypothetical protein